MLLFDWVVIERVTTLMMRLKLYQFMTVHIFVYENF